MIDHTTPSPAGETELGAAQRRSVRVLALSQGLGGIGVASGVAVGALLAEEVSGSISYSGFAGSMVVIGAALLAVPLARMAASRGRAPALSAGYGLAALGAMVVVTAGTIGNFWLLLVGMLLVGGATASGLQARYAATDAAHADRIGRDLSTVMWATTLGAVAGPNLSGAGGVLGEAVGIPALAGPFLFSIVVFVLAGVLITLLLRPDPLVIAQAKRLLAAQTGQPGESGPATGPATGAATGAATGPRAETDPAPAVPRASLWTSIKVVGASAPSRFAMTTIVCAHAIMVGVMVMTPVHLRHGGATLVIVGVVISVHIAGMYALSPVMGWLSDQLGRGTGIAVGSLILAAATFLAGTSGEHQHARLGLALTLLGLGWSACLVAASSLLTQSVPAHARTAVQGVSDLLMGVAGAVAGLASGPLMDAWGYPILSAIAALLLVPIAVTGWRAQTPDPIGEAS